jgi:hypothetical protein
LPQSHSSLSVSELGEINLGKRVKKLKSVGTYNRSVTKEMFFMEAAAADVKYNGGGRGDCRPSRFWPASRNKWAR